MAASRKTWERLLRGGALIGGALLCAQVLIGHAGRLPWPEIALLGTLAALLRQRPVPILRDAHGAALLSHVPGESLLVLALLRHDAQTACATSLLTNALASLWHWRAALTPRWLGFLSNIVYLPSLTLLLGWLYQRLGGQTVRSPDDCGMVFQDPFAVMLPLMGALVIAHEGVNRLYQSLGLFLHRDIPLRQTLTDLSVSVFEHIEVAGTVLALVLWTAWGWATLPFSAFIAEALLLAAREHFQRAEASRAADSDPLTGLSSWRGLSQTIRRQIGAGETFTLLFLDMDRFKQVNDRFGHAEGDALLRRVGETLRRTARPQDTVGRRSGDEFLVILPGTGRLEGERTRERMRDALQAMLASGETYRDAGVGVSLGLAVFPTDGQDEVGLVDMADRRMYHDKRRQREIRLPLAA